MPLLPAEQIGSGRWFNDCFWHPAIPLLHWISNIQLCVLHCILVHSRAAHRHVQTQTMAFLSILVPDVCLNVWVYAKRRTNNNSNNKHRNCDGEYWVCGDIVAFYITQKPWHSAVAYWFLCKTIYIIYLNIFVAEHFSPFVSLSLRPLIISLNVASHDVIIIDNKTHTHIYIFPMLLSSYCDWIIRILYGIVKLFQAQNQRLRRIIARKYKTQDNVAWYINSGSLSMNWTLEVN